MEVIHLAIHDNGVASIVTTRRACAEPELRIVGQKAIDQLPLALITPLHTQNDCGHALSKISLLPVKPAPKGPAGFSQSNHRSLYMLKAQFDTSQKPRHVRT